MDKKDYEKEIRGIRNYSMEQFDKLIVFLSSGAIVLSIGFIGNILDIKTSNHNNILLASWILFVISLFCILLSQKTAQSSMDKYLEKKYIYSDHLDKLTNALNILSFVSLFIGIINLIIFIKINI